MRISGLGLVSANYDPKTQNVSYPGYQKIKDKNCTVIIEAKSGDKKVSDPLEFHLDEAPAKATDSPSPAASASPAISPKKP